ncbi:MAG: RNA polymerase sigma factor [Phycisphaerae bacterium]
MKRAFDAYLDDPAGMAATWDECCRMAVGLTGRQKVARDVVRLVTKQGSRQLPGWTDDEAARRWFRHHTVLACRRTYRHPPGDDDVLLKHPKKPDPAYVSFVKALRKLQMQQREALVLSRLQKLDDRELGTAMDCSTQAARMHLQQAHGQLKPLVGDGYEALLDRAAAALAAFEPPADWQKLDVSRARSISRRKRLLKLARRVVIVVAVLAAAAWLWLIVWPIMR